MGPVAILSGPSINQTLDQGDTAVLECNSQGGPNNTYQWKANRTDIMTETSENLTILDVTAANGGLYTCEVSNFAGNHSASTYLFISKASKI